MASLGGWLRHGAVAAFLLLLIALPIFATAFQLRLANIIGMNSLVVMGLVLLTGYAGLASLGQAAFMGAGAYTAAILASRFGLNPWLGILAGILFAVAVAYLIGLITLRLKGHFLALATLAWGLIITGVLRNWLPVTGGNTGFGSATGNRFPPLSVFGAELRGDRVYFLVVWAAVLLVLWLTHNLMRSRVGRAIKSLRTGSVAAASFGVDVQRTKMLTFLLAAAYAGLAGGLFAFRELFIEPSVAGLGNSIDLLIMAVIGGLTSLWGAIVGSLLFVFLGEALQRYLPLLVGRNANYEGIAFGLLIIFVLHRARRGLMPLIDDRLPKAPPEPVRLDLEPLPPRRSHAASPDVPLLEVRSVSKHFGGLMAVNDLSFQVRRGEIMGLIGPNGAGKTTVFNLVTGVLTPSSGQVLVLGEALQGRPPHVIARRGVARTFQHLNLIGGATVLDNVALGGYTRTRANVLQGMLGLERAEDARTRAEAMRQLTRVGLSDLAFERADSLPMGKQRLLEVGRALMADPLLLMLDEPAAGLRRHEKVALMDLVRKLQAEGATVLLVEHDMDVVMELADRIVVVNYGHMLAQGTPAEVRRDPAVLEAYLGRDAA